MQSYAAGGDDLDQRCPSDFDGQQEPLARQTPEFFVGGGTSCRRIGTANRTFSRFAPDSRPVPARQLGLPCQADGCGPRQATCPSPNHPEATQPSGKGAQQ
jgi:hypothetical protein